MYQLRHPLTPLAFAALVLSVTSCVEPDKAGGTPQLMAFEIIAPDGTPLQPDLDASVVMASPMSSFNAVFNDLLDFTLLQDLDAGTGLPGVAAVAVAGSPMVFTASTVYSPNGHYKHALLSPKGPSLAVQMSPGLPSAATVTVSLDVTKLRGKNGQALVVPAGVASSITFLTSAFSVTGESSEMPFAVDHPFVITTSNMAAADFASKVLVSASVNMVPVMELKTEVKAESSNSFAISPVGGMWPAGALITVTIAADAADQFGIPLGEPVVITFPVAAAAQ